MINLTFKVTLTINLFTIILMVKALIVNSRAIDSVIFKMNLPSLVTTLTLIYSVKNKLNKILLINKFFHKVGINNNKLIYNFCSNWNEN